MQEIIKEFDRRVKDVEQYLHFLKQIHKPQEEGTYGEIDDNLKRILRANAYIIMYAQNSCDRKYSIAQFSSRNRDAT